MAKRKSDGLAKFRARVKAIQRETGKGFRAAQSQASAENKTGSTMKRTKHKVTRRKSHPRKGMGKAPRAKRTIKQKMTGIRNQLALELGKYEEKRISSTTRKAFNHAGKKIKEIKSQIRRLC